MDTSAVGMITRNASQYIQELIAHHYLVGFDRIIIGLDQCDDGTSEKIQQLPSKILAKVDVFDNGPPRLDYGFQHRGYQTIYDRSKDQIEWLAMFDDDEYFYDSKRRPINYLLQDLPRDVSQIALPWVTFTHSKQVLSAPPEVTRLAHFTTRESHRQHVACKTIVRLKHVVTNAIPGGWYHCHSAEVSGKTITFDGKDCPLFGTPPCQMGPEHYNTCLAHYVTGSMEDWVIKYRKWKRENEFVGKKLDRSFDHFMCSDGTIEDNRMSIYVEELRRLLHE
jgi:hypothetical protein